MDEFVSPPSEDISRLRKRHFCMSPIYHSRFITRASGKHYWHFAVGRGESLMQGLVALR
jgi:hypothetical protein